MPKARVPEHIQKLFTETFTAGDIAEPLASFDATTLCGDVRDFLEAGGGEVAGVRQLGQVAGFVEKHSLVQGACGQYLRPFEEAAVLDESASLAEVVKQLDRAAFVFIRLLGRVGGVLVREDLEKPQARMWLFGVVTLIEMRFVELIEKYCPGEDWKQFLSEGRVQKAEALLAERRRRNQSLRLIDCLQFADKGQIIARNEAVRQMTVFASRNQAEEVVKRLEELRNNLAHAQEILSGDWGILVLISEFITLS